MKVLSCPECSKIYRVNIPDISNRNIDVLCSACQAKWTVFSDHMKMAEFSNMTDLSLLRNISLTVSPKESSVLDKDMTKKFWPWVIAAILVPLIMGSIYLLVKEFLKDDSQKRTKQEHIQDLIIDKIIYDVQGDFLVIQGVVYNPNAIERPFPKVSFLIMSKKNGQLIKKIPYEWKNTHITSQEQYTFSTTIKLPKDDLMMVGRVDVEIDS
jgi:predicted Zn finger-like uncharacterized protein